MCLEIKKSSMFIKDYFVSFPLELRARGNLSPEGAYHKHHCWSMPVAVLRKTPSGGRLSSWKRKTRRQPIAHLRKPTVDFVYYLSTDK